MSSTRDIIKESINKDPVSLSEAIAEALRERVLKAVQNKIAEATGSDKDGYYVTDGDNKLTHKEPFKDSKNAISHADSKETKSGKIHTVTKLKAGKIDKQWQYSDSHGGFAHYDDYKGEPFHSQSMTERVE